jgi:predicted aldo/keto reductase-like oxidoreductase
MQYRKFGKSDWNVSALGFGAMRLPMLEDGEKKIVDEAEAIKMIQYSIDHGVNYVDTAYPYHEGQSEVVVGKALQGGYREKVKLATKMPCWLVEKFEDFDKFLDEQLERLQTEHIEFYLLHAIWTDRWEKMQRMQVFDWAEKAIADGRIGTLGFSHHDSFALFKEVIDAYDWGMCQIQYNFMNEDVQAGTEGLEYAAGKGIPVVIMEPLLGGLLAKPPVNVQQFWDKVGENPVDMALQWLWNKPGIATVLSGMSAFEQVQQNIESAEKSGVNTLTQEDLQLVRQVQELYKKSQGIPCTKCGYCMPCPHGVDIPRNFELYNEGVAYNDMGLSRALYSWHFRDTEKANACTACKECEDKCPQQIPISEWMPKIHEALMISQ